MSDGVVAWLSEKGVQVRYAKGGWQACKCPFHEDRSASASVNTTTGRVHCFACDYNEDLIGLIMKDTGAGYVEAKQEAEEKYGAGPSGLDNRGGFGGAVFGQSGDKRANGKNFQSWRSSINGTTV